MPKKYVTGSCALFALTVGFVIPVTPAFAGFEWVAPPSASAYQPQGNSGYVAVPGAPAPQVSTSLPEVISPVIISGTPTQQAVPIVPPSTPVSQAPAYVPAPAPQPAPVAESSYPPATMPITGPAPGTLMAPAKTDSASPAAGNGIVQGFGSQIPLTIALRQILPIGYNFVIDSNVDAETTVSYKGGKGWHETLMDMLAPAGLRANEQGRTITISRAGATALPVASTSPNAPVPPPVMDAGLVISPPAPHSDVALIDKRGRPDVMNMSMTTLRTEDVPSFNVGVSEGWSAMRGDTLRKVLTEWCKRAGVELQWVAEYDYPMEASAHFNGSFEDALRGLLVGFENARPQPVAELHTNAAAGQKILVVQVRGNSYSN